MGNSIVYAVKIALAVAVSMVFVVAIVTIMSFLITLASSSVLGEVIGLISVYLPFNPATVFSSISATIIGITAFMIARKVWTISTATYNQ